MCIAPCRDHTSKALSSSMACVLKGFYLFACCEVSAVTGCSGMWVARRSSFTRPRSNSTLCRLRVTVTQGSLPKETQPNEHRRPIPVSIGMSIVHLSSSLSSAQVRAVPLSFTVHTCTQRPANRRVVWVNPIFSEVTEKECAMHRYLRKLHFAIQSSVLWLHIYCPV